MKNRKLLLIVSIVLALTMSLGGTLAYLTDTDADVNVMTLGRVSITQNEQQRVEKDGEFSAELEAFEQGKEMLPYVNRTATADEVTIGDHKVILSDLYHNYIDKIVTVTNTGNTDAYVRTLVALPTGGWGNTYNVSAADAWLHWNLTKGANNDNSLTYWTDGSASYVFTLNGIEYEVYEFIHSATLAAGKTTFPLLRGCYIDCRVGNDDQGYYIDYGTATNSTGKTGKVRINNFLDANGQLNIMVLSQAVQAGGFADAQTALDTAFGDVTSANAAAWFGGLYNEDGSINEDMVGTPGDKWPNNNPPSEEDKVVTTADDLQKAVNEATEGTTTILLGADLNGNVIITQKAGVNLVIDGTNHKFTGVMTVFGDARQTEAETLTIKNINFVAANGAESCIVSPDRTENNRYSYAHNVTVENCTFTDPDGAVNCAAIRHDDGGDKNWVVEGCKVDNTMHSLLQVNNVEGKLTINNCEIYSKNGVNLNSCTNVAMNECKFDVKGYAVRFGVSSGGNPTEAKTFEFNNSTLKSACNDGDAIIMFRSSAANANTTLKLTATELSGTTPFAGHENVNITIDGKTYPQE